MAFWANGYATAGHTAPPRQDTATTALLFGIDQKTVDTLFAWFAGTSRGVTLFSQGVNQSSAGTDKGSAIINAHLPAGRIGTPVLAR